MLYNPLTRNLDLTPYYAVINFRTKTVLLFTLTVLTSHTESRRLVPVINRGSKTAERAQTPAITHHYP